MNSWINLVKTPSMVFQDAPNRSPVCFQVFWSPKIVILRSKTEFLYISTGKIGYRCIPIGNRLVNLSPELAVQTVKSVADFGPSVADFHSDKMLEFSSKIGGRLGKSVADFWLPWNCVFAPLWLLAPRITSKMAQKLHEKYLIN